MRCSLCCVQASFLGQVMTCRNKSGVHVQCVPVRPGGMAMQVYARANFLFWFYFCLNIHDLGQHLSSHVCDQLKARSSLLGLSLAVFLPCVILDSLKCIHVCTHTVGGYGIFQKVWIDFLISETQDIHAHTLDICNDCAFLRNPMPMCLKPLCCHKDVYF